MGLFDRQPAMSGLCRLENGNISESYPRKKTMKTNEAPYQQLGRRTLSTTLGHKELMSPFFWLSVLSECVSCYIYVFIVCSTRISWTGAIIGHEPNLLSMALSSGISMMLLIFTFRSVHVNPALTISFLVNGRIPLVRAIMYIVAHCLGSIAAIAFLYSISIKGHAGALGLDNPHNYLSWWQILIIETVISFLVTMITYATCNYASYKSAKKLTLQELSQTSNFFQASDTCDKTPVASLHSRRSVAPIATKLQSTSLRLLNSDQPSPNSHFMNQSNFPITATNTRVNTHLKGGPLLATYCNEDGGNYEQEHEYEYDFGPYHVSDSTTPQVPIEEIMEDECQLLAPNGFSLHVTKGQAFVIGLAYTLTSLSGVSSVVLS